MNYLLRQLIRGTVLAVREARDGRWELATEARPSGRPGQGRLERNDGKEEVLAYFISREAGERFVQVLSGLFTSSSEDASPIHSTLSLSFRERGRSSAR